MESNAGLEIGLVFWDGFESVPRGHDLVVRIGFADLSLGVHLVDGEVTGSMEVEIGIEHFAIEAIDGGGVFLRDVTVSHGLTDDEAVLAFGERIVVRLTRARLGEFDA